MPEDDPHHEVIHVIEYSAYKEMEAKLAKAREALEFYATETNWDNCGSNFRDCIHESDCEIRENDLHLGGERARKALKEIGE